MATGAQSLRSEILEIAEAAGAEALAVAFHDYEHATVWGYHADRWFHAASTIKVPVLLGVFDAIQAGVLAPDARVHVRNRFLSAADGRPFKVDAGRDADREVHKALGHTLSVEQLARQMIVTSSNLATNLLVDLVGLDALGASVERLGLGGIEIVRGVEDEAAWEQGINNRVTAVGLVGALRVILEDGHFPPDLRERMVGILHAQEFRSGIPAGLPDDARVANKTGEISTVAHDAGIVYLQGREPWVLAVLTEWQPGAGARRETIAAVARAVYRHVTDGEATEGGEGG